jgi:GntR family transcriptional regulator
MEKKMPKYITIADAIAEDIKNALFKPGERLPTEYELMDRFKVSRMTIRHALSELVRRKVAHTQRRQGVFVSDIEIKRSQEILGVTELFARKGITCISKVTKLERGLPNEEVKQALGLKDGEEIYYLYRTRYAQDEVVVIEYAHIAAKHCPGLEMFNFEKFSFYDILFEHYHLKLSWAKDDIRAEIIKGSDAMTLLNTKSGPALIVVNISYDDHDVPIEYTRQIYNYKVFTYTVISTEISSRYQSKNRDQKTVSIP